MTAYEKICAEACEWCAANYPVDMNMRHFRPHHPGFGAKCYAPSRDAVIERLTAELADLKQSLRRFANPWTVEVQHSSGYWESFCHDAPISLSEAERRIKELKSENPDATFRAVPYLNLSQAEHVRADLAALKRERDELLALDGRPIEWMTRFECNWDDRGRPDLEWRLHESSGKRSEADLYRPTWRGMDVKPEIRNVRHYWRYAPTKWVEEKADA